MTKTTANKTVADILRIIDSGITDNLQRLKEIKYKNCNAYKHSEGALDELMALRDSIMDMIDT